MIAGSCYNSVILIIEQGAKALYTKSEDNFTNEPASPLAIPLMSSPAKENTVESK